MAGLLLVSLAAALMSDTSAWAGVATSRSVAAKARHARGRTPARRAPARPTRKSSRARLAPVRPATGVASGPPAPAPCAAADLGPSPTDLSAIARATVCLIDRERTARGLSALRENADLDLAAAGHSQDMVGTDYFSHAGSNGDSLEARVLASGYMAACVGCALGENVGIGAGGAATPREMVAMWMTQPDHRANILDPGFRDIGVAAVASMPSAFDATDAGATYTADFGSLAAAGG